MTGRRIEFPSDDAARFNALRDEWRGAAASLPLSRSAMRIATVLPTYVNREFGYAFPTDDDLRGILNASKETVKRGLADLEKADLIERETRIKRDDNREAIGRERRIFLCLPTIRSERTVDRGEGSKTAEVKGQKRTGSEGSTPAEVKGQEVKGQAEVKGQKWGGEGSYGGPNILDSDTRDFQIRSGEGKGSVYARERDASPRVGSSVDPSPPRPTHRKGDAPRPAPSLPRNPHWAPESYSADDAFLTFFDRFVIEAAGSDVQAGALERITGEAFDKATKAGDFMPFFWAEVLALRKNPFAEWFRFRAGALIHRREAA